MKSIQQFILLLVPALLLVQATVLWYFGQPFFCACGEIKLWEGIVHSAGNSQQFTDWYTFSHIIHGFLFYLLFWGLFPKSSVATRLILAMGLEISWEIAENTPYIIDLYRQQALASGYTGDSILNSICDTLAMVGGFILARKLPVTVIVAMALVFELFVGYMIHDNLTLNVLNFIHPVEFIRNWQS